jgi:acetate---CoA ligase (ADP-forming)
MRDVSPLIRPTTVAVVGASAKRASQGNIVITNLREWKFPGTIVPVHPSADMIEGLPALRAIDDLPPDVDTAVVAIPAASVLESLIALERANVRSAIVFANGFSAEQEAGIRAFGATSKIAIHGPNCMGLVNFPDSVPLYPARPSLRIRPGRCSLIAQSGSAAISVMNSISVGLSKVVTVGSEFQLAASDYLAWLAADEATDTVGIVAESIKDPVEFAEAVELIRVAGKGLVVLKVGHSEPGSAATKAHTGALITSSDAYDRFFAECGVAVVHDYDELVASMECFSQVRTSAGKGGVAIVGISGGQTALACDIAEEVGVTLARFETQTSEAVRSFLPGNSGENPIDLGATAQRELRKIPEALRAVLADGSVSALAILQDAQVSLNPYGLESYMEVLDIYREVGKQAAKPMVVVSPTSESLHERIVTVLSEAGIPVLRGLRAGLIGVRNLGIGQIGKAGRWARTHGQSRPFYNSAADDLRQELSHFSGTLTPELCGRVLKAYGLPFVRSVVVKDAGQAIERAHEVGFPMAVKIASPDLPHRSDVGGVMLGIESRSELEIAIARIAANVAAAAPRARIDGFELQEQFQGDAEAVVGFVATPPFGSLVVVGIGGTMVELQADRAVGLAPIEIDDAAGMIEATRLGKLLAGYRNLMPKTDTSKLADLVVRTSRLAADLGDLVVACDLNPVLVRKASGAVRLVDALMLSGATVTPENENSGASRDGRF